MTLYEERVYIYIIIYARDSFASFTGANAADFLPSLCAFLLRHYHPVGSDRKICFARKVMKDTKGTKERR